MVAVATTVGVAGAIAGYGGWAPVLLAAVLAVAGAVGFGPLLRPWGVDDDGLYLGRRRVLDWSEVTGIEVRSFATRRGLGPPHVDVVLRSPDRRAKVSLYSRHDARRLHRVLSERLPDGVEGRGLLRLIGDTWRNMD